MTIDESQIMIIGGSGLLGSELRKIYPKAYCPTHNDWDITEPEFHGFVSLDAEARKTRLIIHCAALKSQECEKEKFLAFNTNVLGTFNVVCLAARLGAKLVYISTDYVFNGEKGNYAVYDEVCPINYYGNTKLAGEVAVKALPMALIIRGSFSPEEWPFNEAYTDIFTTKMPVSQFAARIKKAIDLNAYGLHHCAGIKRSLYDYAKLISPDKDIKSKEYLKELNWPDYVIPEDTSLIGTI